MNQSVYTDQESFRLQALYQCSILDTGPEATFDRITRTASLIAGMPTAFISFVDSNRQWFKSKLGISLDETPRNIAFCDYTIQTPNPLIVKDAREDPRFRDNPLVTGEPYIRTYIGMPLVLSDGAIVGSLCVIDYEVRELAGWQLKALHELTGVAVDLIEYRRQSLVDPLTGAYNRRMLSRMGNKEIAHYTRHQRRFSFMVMDLDHFKTINDRHGHAAGDTVLVRIIDCCEEILREEDTLFRMGGEEFGVLFIDTSLDEAIEIGERLRERLAALPIDLGDERIHVTASFGVAEYTSKDTDMDTLIERADAALYQAKSQGRNRLIVAA